MRRIPFVLVTAFVLAGAATAGPTPDASATIAATPSMPSDFDGDGYADLAIGAPQEAIGSSGRYAGGVNVLYGSASGLTATGDQAWSQDSPGIKERSEGWSNASQSDSFGSSLASGDLNGDGYADLAIGVPGETLGSHLYAGAVNVLYGSAHGLTATGDLLLTAPALGASTRLFGWSMATGDLDGDGYDDLAIGTDSERMEIVFGSPTGLHEADALVIDRSGALTIGDLDGDGFGDLVIGQPQADVGGVLGAGTVEVRYGSAAGPSSIRIESWSQDSPGIDDVPESIDGTGPDGELGDHFGAAVTVGDVNGDEIGDLIVASPGEVGDGGAAFNVILGSPDGLTGMGSQFWHRGVVGLPATEVGLGGAFALGDLDGDGDDDLALSTVAPGGAPGSRSAVLTLHGSPNGLTVDGAQVWWQDTPGVPGKDEVGDNFGSALISADFDGSGADDLAIGISLEMFSGLKRAGAVDVLYGTDTGLGAAHAQGWTQDSPGVRGRSEKNDRFGGGL